MNPRELNAHTKACEAFVACRGSLTEKENTYKRAYDIAMEEPSMNPYKRARILADMTQTQLAEELSVTVQTIINTEGDKTIPTLPTILKYAHYFADNKSRQHETFLAYSIAQVEKRHALRSVR